MLLYLEAFPERSHIYQALKAWKDVIYRKPHYFQVELSIDSWVGEYPPRECLRGKSEATQKMALASKNQSSLGVVPTPITPALGRLRQEDCEFQASLGCTERHYLHTHTHTHTHIHTHTHTEPEQQHSRAIMVQQLPPYTHLPVRCGLSACKETFTL
jgi:hypothetical protein